MGGTTPQHDLRSTGERIRHWLVVTALTLAGLLIADLPVLTHSRDRIYLWLEQRLLRSNKSVVVIAIDDNEFWRGELGAVRPLDRNYLAKLLTRIAAADPTVIGLDVGLETNTPNTAPKWERLQPPEIHFLTILHTIVQTCPLVLPRTIAGPEPFHQEYDLFDAKPFQDDAFVSYGHTNCALDLRQIPTRVIMKNGRLLDSFALAVARIVVRDVRPELNDPREPWPYSFFLPNTAFAPKNAPVGPDGLLTAHAVLTAPPTDVRKWLRHQVVLVGGTWHATAHGGDLQDGHPTPIGNLPGVLVHANYVQSLLWDAMYAMPHAWRLSIEVLLSLAISIVFLLAHGWRRLGLVLAMLLAVVLLTWVFSAAIGIFFDMVVPIAFVGVHAVWEGASETFRLDFRRKIPHAEHVFTACGILLVIIVVTIFALHERSAVDAKLATEQRLQVSELRTAPPDTDIRWERTVHSVDGLSDGLLNGLFRSEQRIDGRTAAQRSAREEVAVRVRHSALALKNLHSDLEEAAQARHEALRHEIVSDSEAFMMAFADSSRAHTGETDKALREKASMLQGRVRVLQSEEDRVLRDLLQTSASLTALSMNEGPVNNVQATARQIELTITHQRAAIGKGGHHRTSYQEGAAKLQEALQRFSDDPTDATVPGLLTDADRLFTRAEPEIDQGRIAGVSRLWRSDRIATSPPRTSDSLHGQGHEATADPITSWRDTVLPPGQALTSVLDCFSPAATVNLLPRTDGDHLVVLVPAHAFDLGANLSGDTIRQMRPIMNALLDDPTLRVAISVAPTNVSKETIDYFAPHRIESVRKILVGVGIEASRITSDPRSVPHADESNAVNLTLTVYRQ